MNVSETQFGSYLEKFHTTLQQTADEFLSEHKSKLFHLSFLPARIKGFISTQFGVAWEYVSAPQTCVEVLVGSARIEPLFLGQPGRIVRRFEARGPTFMLRGASHTTLEEHTSINEPVPFFLQSNEARLTLIGCHFDALGWSRDVIGAEIFGTREETAWSSELAVGRAKDEVLAALVELTRAAQRKMSLGEYIAVKKQKGVLVLGGYSPEGMARLKSICDCVAAIGYEPFLVKDVPDIFGSDLPQKVVILGGLVRFVLIDDSSPSGHLSEVPLAQLNRWITVLLRSRGRKSSWMAAGGSITSTVLREQEFDPESPCIGVESALAWAETKIADLEQKYRDLYPWRL